MIPKYEIFASLLTGAWMPWLENNRQQEWFGGLLQSVNNRNGNRCSTFFRMLVKHSGSMQSPSMQRFSREAGYLADACSRISGKGGTPFLSLPAATPRQQFYNLLTGYSFSGYDRWASGILTEFRGTEMCDWYLKRMAGTLTDLLQCTAPWDSMEQPDRLIAWRARAALCVLLHRLTASGTGDPGTLLPPFPVREALLAGPASFFPDGAARNEIMELFDALTGDSKPTVPAPAVHAPTPPAARQLPAAPAQAEPDLIPMVMEIKGTVDAMVQAVNLLVNAGPPKEKQPVNEPEKYIDGAKVRQLLATSTSSMQRYRNSGKLPYIKIGSKYCYALKDVYNFIEQGKQQKIKANGNLTSGKPKH